MRSQAWIGQVLALTLGTDGDIAIQALAHCTLLFLTLITKLTESVRNCALVAVETLEGMLHLNGGLDLLVLEISVEVQQLSTLLTTHLFEALQKKLTLIGLERKISYGKL